MDTSITFDTESSRIIVTDEAGATVEYTDEATYLADYPERVRDFAALSVDRVVTVPQTVDALQGLLALAEAGQGLAEAYDAWSKSSARTFIERAFIDKAKVWRRDDPTLLSAAAAFGLSEQQIDDLFILAATK